MHSDTQDVLRVLRYELNYLQQGGYGSAQLVQPGVAEPPDSPFLGNHSCINFGDPLRSHACRECSLWMFVPESRRTEDIPCHFIVLNSGETVQSLLARGDRAALVLALEEWLRLTIALLEAQMQRPAKSA